MQSPRAPLYVFFAAFLTFLMAFAGLLVVLKPELDRRRAASNPAAKAPEKPTLAAIAGSAAPERKADRASRSATEPPAAPQPEIEVHGRVVDSRGAAVSGATVHLVALPAEGRELRRAPPASVETSTDGRFSLRGPISPRGGVVLATAPGCARSEKKSVSVGDGPTADVGDLALRPGGVLRVRVIGDGSRPIAGAEVSLTPQESFAGISAGEAVSSRTAADGSVSLSGIDVAEYRVHASAAEHADVESAWRFDGSVRRASESLELALLPLHGFVAGNAVDVAGAPISSGEVIARLVRPDPPAPQEWRAPLDERGQFKVGPLPRGTYSLELVAADMVQKAKIVAECDGVPVEISAEHGGSALVRIAASVETLDGPPRVTLWRADPSGRTQPLPGSCRVEGDAGALQFRVGGLCGGRYVLRVAADGFAAARSEPFTLEPGAPSPEVAIALGEGGRIRGRIVDARGAPVAGARISTFEGIAPPPPALVELFPADARATLTTEASGDFELCGLSPGSQVLVIEASGQPARTVGPLLVHDVGDVLLGPVTLGGGTILSATLLDGAGRPAPLGRALVSTIDGHVHVAFLADGEGNFCLRGLAEGDYVLSALDGTTGRAELTLRANETGRVEIRTAVR